ncbi:MAG: efflux RND transporter periplasmic adaptor subunit [Bacteroidales bacterium]|nr:efflux RND transporter periplasmic adaptor subunit [Bacteroidales bacterium]
MKKILIALLSTTIAVCSCTNVPQENQKTPIRVITQVVSNECVSNTYTYIGIVEESEKTAVSFTSMGVLKSVLVREGQSVKAGDLIAQMDDSQARNILSASQAQMEQANDALKRFEILHNNGSLPEVKWIEIQSKVAQAKSQLEVAKKNLADCNLISPVSGIVGKKSLAAGETAMPSQAVVTILKVGSVKVKVSIPEKEINSISSNTSSIVKVDATGSTYTGGSIEKGIQADALTRTYDIRINVKNSDYKLLPGMIASVTFNNMQGENSQAISIPVTSVQKSSTGDLFVWTIDNENTAHRTTVNVGAVSGNNITITNGLAAGTRVVTEGYQKLNEGTKVIY